MFFIKLMAFVLIFAVPLGILCGLAAKQAELGRISRFPDHKIPFPNIILHTVTVVGIVIAISIHQGTFSFVVVGLIAIIIIPTGLIGFLTYTLLMRAKHPHHNALDRAPVKVQGKTKGEQAGVKLAEWVQGHQLAARLIFWGIFAAAILLFIHTIRDITSHGKWLSAAIMFTGIGLRVWSATRTKQPGN